MIRKATIKIRVWGRASLGIIYLSKLSKNWMIFLIRTVWVWFDLMLLTVLVTKAIKLQTVIKF